MNRVGGDPHCSHTAWSQAALLATRKYGQQPAPRLTDAVPGESGPIPTGAQMKVLPPASPSQTQELLLTCVPTHSMRLRPQHLCHRLNGWAHRWTDRWTDRWVIQGRRKGTHTSFPFLSVGTFLRKLCVQYLKVTQ